MRAAIAGESSAGRDAGLIEAGAESWRDAKGAPGEWRAGASAAKTNKKGSAGELISSRKVARNPGAAGAAR